MTFYDLVLLNGELVRIECQDKNADQIAESLNNCMKRGDWFSPSICEGTKCDYLGMGLERVNMKLVIGMLP